MRILFSRSEILLIIPSVVTDITCPLCKDTKCNSSPTKLLIKDVIQLQIIGFDKPVTSNITGFPIFISYFLL